MSTWNKFPSTADSYNLIVQAIANGQLQGNAKLQRTLRALESRLDREEELMFAHEHEYYTPEHHSVDAPSHEMSQQELSNEEPGWAPTLPTFGA